MTPCYLRLQGRKSIKDTEVGGKASTLTMKATGSVALQICIREMPRNLAIPCVSLVLSGKWRDSSSFTHLPTRRHMVQLLTVSQVYPHRKFKRKENFGFLFTSADYCIEMCFFFPDRNRGHLIIEPRSRTQRTLKSKCHPNEAHEGK